MAEEIPILLIDDNPYNPRIQFDRNDTEELAASLGSDGLLQPVKLRKVADRYQLVYGHRRFRAAKSLGWKKIRAEIGTYSDEQMLYLALAENIKRKNLSDFAKGLSFLRVRKEFGRTYEEIGKTFGYSRFTICNYVRMAELFDENTLSKDSTILPYMHMITERHARILAQIKDVESRVTALQITANEGLSARELQGLVRKLRSWFPTESAPTPSEDEDDQESFRSGCKNTPKDFEQIMDTINAQFELTKKGDFESYQSLYNFENTFSFFSGFLSLSRFDSQDAFEKKRYWFYNVAPHLVAIPRDIRVQFFGDTALATLYVDYKGQLAGRKLSITGRGTVLFARNSGHWKIVHEHWSHSEEKMPSESVTIPSSVFPGKHLVALQEQNKSR